MPKKSKSIPVNTLSEESEHGVAFGRIAVKKNRIFKEAAYAHRHDFHLFFCQEEGMTPIEIDFQQYQMEALSLVYIHPSQVHKMDSVEKGVVAGWAINNENLNPEYLKLLEEIAPAGPMIMDQETFTLISEMLSLCIKFSARKGERLYRSLLKDSCNVLVALVVSQYMGKDKAKDYSPRFAVINKAFKSGLEDNFPMLKRPAFYAQLLNISTAYLNECVKKATGQSVSYHIQQRIILEAKRLLFHSDKTVKEIAVELGYEDYPYFSRLFTKVTGMTPLAFRRENRD